MPVATPNGLLLAATLSAAPVVAGTSPRYRGEFTIVIHAEPRAALDLFGAEGERAWAGPHWNPQFLQPRPARDQAGAIFLVTPPGKPPILGYTTVFDREACHVRHLLVRGHDSVTVIDVRIVPAGVGASRATVVFERTALHRGAEEEVRTLAAGDPSQAAEWEAAINAYLAALVRAAQ